MKNNEEAATILKSTEFWESFLDYDLAEKKKKAKENNTARIFLGFAANDIQNMRDFGMNYLDIVKVLNSIMIKENIDNSLIFDSIDIIIDTEYKNTEGKDMKKEKLKKTIKDYFEQNKKK
jgi:hypothetical protein